MNESDLSKIEACRNLSIEAHKGQTRWGGEDYYTCHILGVEKIARDNLHLLPIFLRTEALCVALLHDTLEDTKLDQLSIAMACKSKIATDSVKTLTRSTKNYYEYICKITNSNCLVSMFVKMCDLKHNMSDLDQSKPIYTKYAFAFDKISAKFYEKANLFNA